MCSNKDKLNEIKSKVLVSFNAYRRKAELF